MSKYKAGCKFEYAMRPMKSRKWSRRRNKHTLRRLENDADQRVNEMLKNESCVFTAQSTKGTNVKVILNIPEKAEGKAGNWLSRVFKKVMSK